MAYENERFPSNLAPLNRWTFERENCHTKGKSVFQKSLFKTLKLDRANFSIPDSHATPDCWPQMHLEISDVDQLDKPPPLTVQARRDAENSYFLKDHRPFVGGRCCGWFWATLSLICLCSSGFLRLAHNHIFHLVSGKSKHAHVQARSFRSDFLQFEAHSATSVDYNPDVKTQEAQAIFKQSASLQRMFVFCDFPSESE